MRQPFQCLLLCPNLSCRSGVILAASGPFIHGFNAQNGRHLSTWPTHDTEGNPIYLEDHSISTTDSANDDTERPVKKRKTSLSREVSSSTSAEILVGNPHESETGSKSQVPSSDIIKLTCTSDGTYVVAVTGEDKILRVFQLTEPGVLIQLSERPMPKRPCAIALTPDNSTILCGDKFGDVYSLPLLGKANDESANALEVESKGVSGELKAGFTPFVPAASSKTVHTKKNQEALRNQQRQIRQKKEKNILNFEHQLLLGHVSLLTDLTCLSLDESDSPSGKRREYIITSDRDEHIRVSRSIPQAHVIEGYCQGHTEFISKICIVQTHRQLLVSGGGDGQLLVWDWLHGTLRQRIDLRGPINKIREAHRQYRLETGNLVDILQPDTESKEQNIAITGIWSSACGRIVAVCEGVPALLIFLVNDDLTVGPCYSKTTGLNVIDLATLNQAGIVVYSLDIQHEPFTTEESSSEGIVEARPVFGCMDLNSPEDRGRNGNCFNEHDIPANLNDWARTHGHSSPTILSYSLESLRKKGYNEET